jgi:hypothetical protein
MATRMPSLPSRVRRPFRSRRHGRMHQGAGAWVSTTAALHMHEVVVTVGACDGQQPLSNVRAIAGFASDGCPLLRRTRGRLRRPRRW